MLRSEREIIGLPKGGMDRNKALLEEVSCENNILKECLEDETKNVEDCYHSWVITIFKALLEEIHYTNYILQQQQQHANEEIERLNKNKLIL